MGGRDLDRRNVAALARRSPETIRRWEREGKLTRNGSDDSGRVIYSAASVGRQIARKRAEDT